MQFFILDQSSWFQGFFDLYPCLTGEPSSHGGGLKSLEGRDDPGPMSESSSASTPVCQCISSVEAKSAACFLMGGVLTSFVVLGICN